MLDITIIANPGEIILIKVGKEKQQGFYAKVIDVTADKIKRGFWVVTFYPLIPTKDFKLMELSWILDDQQIRGQEYTMNDVPHQLFRIEFPEAQKAPVIDHIDKNAKHMNDILNLQLKNQPSDSIPHPERTIGKLTLVVNNPKAIRNPLKTYRKPDLYLVK